MLLIIKIIVSVKMQMSVILCSHGLLDWFNKTILHCGYQSVNNLMYPGFPHPILKLNVGLSSTFLFEIQNAQDFRRFMNIKEIWKEIFFGNVD